MSFVSLPFLLLLIPVLLVRWTLGRTRTETGFLFLLLVASLVFYGWHVPWHVLLLVASAAIDFLAASRIAALPEGHPRRRSLLELSLVSNLLFLGIFKYGDFGLESYRHLLRGLGLSTLHVPHLGLALPVGISFFTFQSMSYTIDVYRGLLAPVASFWEFLLFVSFFPQLVAGPIVRARDFFYQVRRPRRPHGKVLHEAAYLITQGLFLKMVVADGLAQLVEAQWRSIARPGACSALTLVVVLAFSGQIFADFTGYSRIARGLAYLLGFRLPVNFNAPYLATSFSDFWRRWHISLSTWLRDYLYVPLGGNRGTPRTTLRNLMLVMLLGGLWHGAAWTFLVWGLLHGIALVVERSLDPDPPRTLGHRLLRLLAVQSWVLLTWIFFRASSLGEAVTITSNLLHLHWTSSISTLLALPHLERLLPVLLLHLYVAASEAGWWQPRQEVLRSFLIGAMLYGVLCFSESRHAFLYFQF